MSLQFHDDPNHARDDDAAPSSPARYSTRPHPFTTEELSEQGLNSGKEEVVSSVSFAQPQQNEGDENMTQQEQSQPPHPTETERLRAELSVAQALNTEQANMIKELVDLNRDTMANNERLLGAMETHSAIIDRLSDMIAPPPSPSAPSAYDTIGGMQGNAVINGRRNWEQSVVHIH